MLLRLHLSELINEMIVTKFLEVYAIIIWGHKTPRNSLNHSLAVAM